ncbi:MAG: nucleotidyltransferase domain-containing protein, partial [Candidatus Binatia bacterium]
NTPTCSKDRPNTTDRLSDRKRPLHKKWVLHDMAFNDTGLSAENELLLCCARTRLNDEALERVRTLSREELDWGHITRTALTHGVAPLLYSTLRATCPGAVPKTTLDRLRDLYRANVGHSFLLTAELLKLLELFETHGIHAIPFKGPVLAASAYRDFSLRQFGDLDILVHKQNILRGGRLLVLQGYRRSGSDDGEAREHEDHEEIAFLRPKFHAFVRQDRGIRIDLQWRVTEKYFSFSLDKEPLWERLAPVSIAGRTVLTFAPMDMLLILCVHGSKHRWEKLKWICDVAELVGVHKNAIDWEKIRQEAARQGAERMLRLGLLLAHEFLGAALPEEISQEVQADFETHSVAREIRARFFSLGDRPRGDFSKVMFYLRTKDRLRDRLQFCFRYLSQYLQAVVTPTAKEAAALPLPASLFFLYYFFRPLRLTAKYGRLGWTVLCKGKNSPS